MSLPPLHYLFTLPLSRVELSSFLARQKGEPSPCMGNKGSPVPSRFALRSFFFTYKRAILPGQERNELPC